MDILNLRTKAGATDDAAPTGAVEQFVIPHRYDAAKRLPTGALAVFVELYDAVPALIGGASVGLELWVKAGGKVGATNKWFRIGPRVSGITNQRLAIMPIPKLPSDVPAYLRVVDVAGAPASIKVYVAPTGEPSLAVDPVTGALRSSDILQRGGEQNAIGVHMISERVHQSADGAPSWDDSAALETSSVTKAGPGNVYGFVAHNTNAATRYFQLFDSTTVPADTAVPKMVFAIPTGVTIVVPEIPGKRRYFATGISWAFSTTLATKTLGAAECFASVAFG